MTFQLSNMCANFVMARWMSATLLAAGAMNMFGAALFMPAFRSLRQMAGLPAESHPLYLWIIAGWIFLFGLCYLWLGISGRNERLFLVIGAAGKLTFVILLIIYSMMGQVPLVTAISSLPDLLFATAFVLWLWRTRNRQISIESPQIAAQT